MEAIVGAYASVATAGKGATCLSRSARHIAPTSSVSTTVVSLVGFANGDGLTCARTDNRSLADNIAKEDRRHHVGVSSRHTPPSAQQSVRSVRIAADQSGSSEVLSTESAEVGNASANSLDTEVISPNVEAVENSTATDTKPSVIDEKKGKIVEFLSMFLNLLDMPFGAGQAISGAGNVVLTRVRADAESLCDAEGVNQQYVFEFLRLTGLLNLDMELISSARKVETLMERLKLAKAHCRQAIDIAKGL